VKLPKWIDAYAQEIVLSGILIVLIAMLLRGCVG